MNEDNIDTSTVQRRLIFNLSASFAEFERELIRERTMAGLKAARENGRIGGRKSGLTPEVQRKALAVYQITNRNRPKEQRMSVPELAKAINVSRATYYRYIDWVKEY